MYNSLENQQEEQDIQKAEQFKAWFFGPEIQGDSTTAVHSLAEKIGKLSSMENLMDAYYYVEPKKIDTSSSSEQSSDDDLPF